MNIFAHFAEPESFTNLKDSNESWSHFGVPGTRTIKRGCPSEGPQKGSYTVYCKEALTPVITEMEGSTYVDCKLSTRGFY